MKNYYSFAHTHVGFSHISSQKPCQDYSLHFDDDTASVVIVSDGHGSSNFTRSERGSCFACEVSADAVNQFLRDLDLNELDNEFHRDAVVAQLCKYILLQWNARIDGDVSREPFTEEEVEKVSDKYRDKYLRGEAVEHAYGCTLIIAVITRDFFLAIRNGDGQCVAVDQNGGFTTPIPWNENCEFNVTTSLCDHEAIEDFRYYYSRELPAAVFIGSDGVDDSYASVDDLYNLYRNICLKALRDGTDAAADYVEILLPELTRRGSMDDVSIAGLIDSNALQNAQLEMEIAIEVRRLQLVEEHREQQKRVLIRDIKLAEKKKTRAVARRQDIQLKLREAQEEWTEHLVQKALFRPKSETNAENISFLTDEEQKLADLICEVDREIERLNKELQALDGTDEAADLIDCNAPLAVEPEEGTEQDIADETSDRSEPAEEETKADEVPAEQSTDEEPESRQAADSE